MIKKWKKKIKRNIKFLYVFVKSFRKIHPEYETRYNISYLKCSKAIEHAVYILQFELHTHMYIYCSSLFEKDI